MSSERVLISMKRFIGDSIMAAPLVDAMNERYPDLTILCSAPVAQILWSGERHRSFLPLDTKRKPMDVLRAAMVLRKERFGIGILVNQSFRSAITLKLAGVSRLIGHAAEGRNWLLSKAVPYSETEFEAWSMLDLARPLGIDPPKVRPTLYVTDEERRKGLEVLAGATIGLQPGATFAAKMLPVEMLAEVGSTLQKQGHRIALFGAEAEREAGERLAAALAEPPVNLLGKTSIRESLGALTHLERMIGADTGLMHMAAAVGCPTVTVFGPTPAIKWGHQYGPHKVILAPDGDMSKVSADAVLSQVRA